jgi:hypothetical protein
MPKYTLKCERCEKEKETINSKPLSDGEFSGMYCACGGKLVKYFVPYVINGNFGNTSKYRAGDK